MNKLYVLTYQEVQIAGYRIFPNYTDALKEYLKHCILETRELLKDEAGSDEEDCGSSTEEFDDMTCIFEIQQLENNEYVTIKEYDYEAFQMLIESEDDIPLYLSQLDASIDEDKISGEVLSAFSE